MKKESNQTGDMVFTFGHEEVVIHHRYEVISMINDLLVGIWFVVGSVCFFYEGAIQTAGVWLFVIGSVQLLIRPAIRLSRSIQLKRLPPDTGEF